MFDGGTSLFIIVTLLETLYAETFVNIYLTISSIPFQPYLDICEISSCDFKSFSEMTLK